MVKGWWCASSLAGPSIYCMLVPDNRETLPIFNLLEPDKGYYMLVLAMQIRSKTLSTFSLLLQVGPIIRCMLLLHISAAQTRSKILSMFIPFVEECMFHCSLEQITSVILNYGIRAGSV